MSDESPTAEKATPPAGTEQTAESGAPAQGATAVFPGIDRLPTAAQRPEVLIGAAFGGAFIVARILKRIFD